MKPILIYGASGFTGRCCVAAAEAAGIPYLIGGRDPARLDDAAGPGCAGQRIADALEPAALARAFEGVGCVISAAGPFARLGPPVLDAAIQSGAHYVDTCAEQSFIRAAKGRHDAAVTAGVTALPASGVEYAPMFLAAALLGRGQPSPGPVEAFLWLDDFLPTRGSVRSMFAMAGVGPTPWPRRVQIDERGGWAIQIPGAEAVMVHPESRTWLVLRLHEAAPFAPTWPIARRLPLERLADRVAALVEDPSPEARAAAGFTVVVARGERALRIDGRDVYASTGHFAVQLAAALARGEARAAGTLPTGAALEPSAALAALGLEARPAEIRRRPG